MRCHFERATAIAPVASLVLFLAVGACAPLAQAPLIYSSKNSYGIDISATSTETPGVSFAIGVKLVDAAYVPVAVAVPCEGVQGQGTPAACADSRYELQRIQGTSTLQDNSSPLAQLAEKRKSEVAVATALALTKQAEFDKANLALTTDQALAKTIAAAQTARDATQDGTPAREEAQAKLDAANAASSRVPTDQKTLTTVQAELGDANRARDAAQKAYDAAVTARSVSSATQLTDAYSVFGTFDGQGKGGVGGAPSTPGANGALDVGKMFSTGIASQNLSTSMRYQFMATCLAKAKEAIIDVNAETKLTDPQKAQAVAALYMLCPNLAQSAAHGE